MTPVAPTSAASSANLESGTASAPRLSRQSEVIGTDTSTIRSLDWDRSRFDIEFGLRNGTTYNAFLVRGNARPSSTPPTPNFATAGSPCWRARSIQKISII